MDQALYFPENLPPTWGNSWAQVMQGARSFNFRNTHKIGVNLKGAHFFLVDVSRNLLENLELEDKKDFFSR